ncbi:MAG: carbohydrate ABC transporter permease [Acidimicrobiia bacterium]|jgi:sn-glycerol 3-phosphate transport system permease protein|nr:carbohydrate ABC transporter permease [Thermoanaerobacterales bacterium]
MPADPGAPATATALPDEGVVTMPADDVIGGPIHGAPPAAVAGRSHARRVAGLVGQYALLVVLAAVVLLPVAFAVIQALSPPFPYINEGKPLHPVAVQWKDRGWLDGGAVSVVLRTLVVVAALAWVQLRAAGGTLRAPAPLVRSPRRLAAVVAGTVAVAALASQVWSAAVDRSTSTPAWWLATIAAVAATQLVGFGLHRPVWRPLLLAALVGVATTAIVVVAFGAAVWNQGWDQARLGPAMTRSLVVTVLITVAQVLTSILAAYAFAFLRFPAKTLLFALFMGTLLLPIEVTLLANVQTIRELGWINSNAGLVVPFAATAFGTFLIRQGFRGVPPEIQDATRLDGYGHMAFLWRFAVPLTRPVIASFTVIAALNAWNQYLWPQAVIDDSRYETAQIALKTISATDVANANVGVAAALIVALPVVALLLAFQRQIIRGLTAGAVKG